MIPIGGLTVEAASGRVWRGSEELDVPELERRFLGELARRAPAVVPRADMARVLWSDGAAPGPKALDMAWSRLRKRLAPDGTRALLTVRGVGFLLQRHAAAAPTVEVRDEGIPGSDTPFIGFADDLRKVHTWLARPAERWLTISGVGGTGKTRLATEFARQARVDGRSVVWVDLAPVPDGDPVLRAVGRRLGVELGRSAEPVDAALRAALSARSRLLFLDNLEHVPLASARLGALVASCPLARVVATSRRRLGVPGERNQALRGLRVSDEAPALYASLVRQFFVAPDPAMLDERLVDTVCRVSRGHPLTIELAVATLRRGAPAQLLRALETPSRLQGERSGRTPRHASFESTFDHSWSLLSAGARRALAALSLFSGGFTASMAHELVDVEAAALAELVDQSLLERDDVDLSLHPLVREVAARALAGIAPGGEVAEQFRTRQLAWIGDQADGLRREDDPGLPARVEARIHDLAVAWHHAASHRNEAGLAQAWPGICAWIELRENHHLGVSLVEAALAAVSDPGFRLELRLTLAVCRIPIGLSPEAGPLLEEALSQPECIDAQRVYALAMSAVQRAWTGDLPGADATLAEAAECARSVDDPETLARLHLAYGTRYRIAARSDLGGEHSERALRLARASGVGALVRRALIRHAAWLYSQSRFAEAVSHAIEVEILSGVASDPYSVDSALNIHALGLRQLGDLEGSLIAFTRLLADGSRATPTSRPYLGNQRATALLDVGRLDEAEHEIETALTLAEAHGLSKDISFVTLTRGNLLLARGEHAQAVATGHARRAFEAERMPDNPASQTLTSLLVLTGAWLAGDQASAREALERARQEFKGKPPYVQHLLELGAGLVWARDGDVEQTARSVTLALDIAERSGPVAVRRALFPALLALAVLGEHDLAEAATPVLRDGPLLERWIYLPTLEAEVAGVPRMPGRDLLRDPAAVLSAVRERLVGITRTRSR